MSFSVRHIGAFVAFCLLFACGGSWALQAIPTTGKITLDGKLIEADWARAPVFNEFIENTPREKVPAMVRTEVRVLFDHDALYFGLRAYDPDPSKIVAPFVRRDKVFGNQDNFVVWVDPTGARKFAQFFRVNARGILADGVWNEDSGDEDFSPDFDFEAVPVILADGWSAEMRIPWSSLRLPHPAPNKLSFIVFRNMPRDTRVRMSTASLGRDPSCFLCVADDLIGIRDLPRASGLTVAPFVTVNSSRTREGNAPTASETRFTAGADVKWRPTPEWVLDATFRPDFSQLELDTPQLKGNTRFALQVQEKRPFFLEGTDLYSTPWNLIYTRSVTDPAWGARATYRSPTTDATVLTVNDKGGGFVIIPGTYYSDYRDQGPSQSTVARVRQPFAADLGTGSIGALFSDRTYRDGTTNRAAAVDAIYRPNNETRFRAQVSGSQTDERAPLSVQGKSTGSLTYVDGNFDDGVTHFWSGVTSVSPGFRSDNSIASQVGYQMFQFEGWRCAKREGFFYNVCPGLAGKEQHTWSGEVLNRWVTPSIYVNGQRNSEWNLQARWFNYARAQAGGVLHHVPSVYAKAEGNPGGWLPYAFVEVEMGRGIDVLSDSLARMMYTGITINSRPLERVEIEWKLSDFRLHDLNSSAWRLHEYSAQLVAVGYLPAQDSLRLIAQRTLSKRNAAMYEFSVTPRVHTQAVSLVYAHKRGLGRELNIGVTHGNARISATPNRMTTEVFAKLSWAVSL